MIQVHTRKCKRLLGERKLEELEKWYETIQFENELKNEKETQRHFWYSKKQKKHCGERKIIPIIKLENGEKKEYTEATIKNIPSGNWDDYIYLGKGKLEDVIVTYQRLKSLACLSAKSREAYGRVTLLPD